MGSVHRSANSGVRMSAVRGASSSSRRTRFLEKLAEATQAEMNGVVDLDERLLRLEDDARSRWPTLEHLLPKLLPFVAERLDLDLPPAERLQELYAGDLLVSLGCLEGDAAALEVFFAQKTPEIARALRRLDLGPALRAELLQDLQARLLVGTDLRPPLLARYHGSGPLRRWLQATAVNTALKMVSRERLVPVGGAEAVISDAAEVWAPDPELTVLRESYRVAFDRAFRDALAQLAADERLLLRQHFVDGLSIDALGRLYSVHRATAARRLVRARGQLYRHTRTLLEQRLEVGQPTFRSLCRVVISELDLSLGAWDQLVDVHRDGSSEEAPGGSSPAAS